MFPIVISGQSVGEIFTEESLRLWVKATEAEISREELIGLGVAAREVLEKETNRVFRKMNYLIKLNGFFNYTFHLQPLHSVVSVKYYDENGTLQTLSNDLFALVEYSDVHKELVFSEDAQDITLKDRLGKDAVQVTISAGYDVESAPNLAKHFIRLCVRDWYDNPAGKKKEFPDTASKILENLRIYQFS